MAEAARSHATQAKLAQFTWDDAFLLDEQLSEDERLIRDTARDYAQDKLAPRVSEAYLNEATDRAIFNEMGELGLLGVTIFALTLPMTRLAVGTPEDVAKVPESHTGRYLAPMLKPARIRAAE